MEVTNELMTRFFRREITTEERELISFYFDQHPNEMNKYLNEDDWQNFEAEAELHPAVSGKILRNVKANINVQLCIADQECSTQIVNL